MSHLLVIAEKPSVGIAIGKALGVTSRKDGYLEGNGYLISWCIGHLVELADAAAYGEQYKMTLPRSRRHRVTLKS